MPELESTAGFVACGPQGEVRTGSTLHQAQAASVPFVFN